jgi:hypothetical protein
MLTLLSLAQAANGLFLLVEMENSFMECVNAQFTGLD